MRASKVVLNILYICIKILIFVLILLGLIKLGTIAYDMGYRVFTEKPMEDTPGTDVVVEITDDMSAFSIGTVLEEKNLIRDAYVFVIQMKLSAYADEIKPGLYTLNTTQTAREMLEVMAAADSEDSDEDEDAKETTKQ